MGTSVNKWHGIGQVVSVPKLGESKFAAKPMCLFKLMIYDLMTRPNRKYFECVAFTNTAMRITKHFNNGSWGYFEGKPDTFKHKRTGQDVFKLVISTVLFLPNTFDYGKETTEEIKSRDSLMDYLLEDFQCPEAEEYNPAEWEKREDERNADTWD